MVGSGKTLSYLLPIVHRILSGRQTDTATDNLNRPFALVVVPSLELAQQTEAVALDLTEGLDIQVSALCGRSIKCNVKRYLGNLRAQKKPMDILIASPGILSKALTWRE